MPQEENRGGFRPIFQIPISEKMQKSGFFSTPFLKIALSQEDFSRFCLHPPGNSRYFFAQIPEKPPFFSIFHFFRIFPDFLENRHFPGFPVPDPILDQIRGFDVELSRCRMKRRTVRFLTTYTCFT